MRTVLYDEHVKMNANIVDFHGWDMPLYYESIIKEHMYVRERCGVFDVSHMGDIFLTGSGAEESLMKLFPSDISKMKEGDCLYTAFLNNDGNMIDDTIIYKFNKEKFLCVPNAATTDKILDHILKNKTNNCEVKNSSSELSCIAIQGKDSVNIMKNLGLKFPDFFKFYEEKGMIISGTGYTGEIGCEIIIKNNEAVNLWEKIVDDLKKIGCGPCGLGSRDTLRMEKGMLLSGQDFNSDKNPYEASISFIVDNDHNYIGREKLLSNQKPERIFRGIIMNEKGSFPRHGNLIYDESGKEIGIITSGSISPILGKGIGLGYINRNESKSDTSILVGIRDKKFNGKVSRPRIVP
jgi:aminomethyltransferase